MDITKLASYSSLIPITVILYAIIKEIFVRLRKRYPSLGERIVGKIERFWIKIKENRFIIARDVFFIIVVLSPVFTYQFYQHPHKTTRNVTINALDSGAIGKRSLDEEGNAVIILDAENRFFTYQYRYWNEDNVLKKLSLDHKSNGTNIRVVNYGKSIDKSLLVSERKTDEISLDNQTVSFDGIIIVYGGPSPYYLYRVYAEWEKYSKEYAWISFAVGIYAILFVLISNDKARKYRIGLIVTEKLLETAKMSDRLHEIRLEKKICLTTKKEYYNLLKQEEIGRKTYDIKVKKISDTIESLEKEEAEIIKIVSKELLKKH